MCFSILLIIIGGCISAVGFGMSVAALVLSISDRASRMDILNRTKKLEKFQKELEAKEDDLR